MHYESCGSQSIMAFCIRLLRKYIPDLNKQILLSTNDQLSLLEYFLYENLCEKNGALYAAQKIKDEKVWFDTVADLQKEISLSKLDKENSMIWKENGGNEVTKRYGFFLHNTKSIDYSDVVNQFRLGLQNNPDLRKCCHEQSRFFYLHSEFLSLIEKELFNMLLGESETFTSLTINQVSVESTHSAPLFKFVKTELCVSEIPTSILAKPSMATTTQFRYNRRPLTTADRVSLPFEFWEYGDQQNKYDLQDNLSQENNDVTEDGLLSVNFIRSGKKHPPDTMKEYTSCMELTSSREGLADLLSETFGSPQMNSAKKTNQEELTGGFPDELLNLLSGTFTKELNRTETPANNKIPGTPESTLQCLRNHLKDTPVFKTPWLPRINGCQNVIHRNDLRVIESPEVKKFHAFSPPPTPPVDTHTHIYNIYIYIYIYIYVCVCVCVCIYTHTHIYIYIYIYVSRSGFVYVIIIS